MSLVPCTDITCFDDGGGTIPVGAWAPRKEAHSWVVVSSFHTWLYERRASRPPKTQSSAPIAAAVWPRSGSTSSPTGFGVTHVRVARSR